MKCIYCNTELKQGAKFCPNCGKEVIEFNQCVKCGEQIKAGALFCPHCGAKQQIEEDVVSEMIPQEEMTDPRNDEKAVIHEQSIIKEIGEPQEGNEAHVIQDENIPISESPKDDLANTLEPYKSGQSSKKWLWILGVILLLCIIGGGWFFLNNGNLGNEVATPIEEVDSIAEVADSINADIHSVEGVKMRLDEIFRNGLNMQEGKAVNTYFTQEYRELFDKVSEYDNTHDLEGPGFWQGNIWDGGQDSNPNLFKVISLNSVSYTRAYAAIKLIYEHGDYHSENLINVDLAFENGNWYVDNIGGQKEGMKEYLSLSTNETTYNGTFSMIGHVSQDDIHMKIEIDNSSVQGRYYYDSRGSSNQVRLEGMIDDNGNMKLTMYGNDGEAKGYFIGAFDGSTYSGQFVHNSIDENLQFSVSVE